MFRILVYTAVFEDYDRVLPPLWIRPGLNYHLLTDDPTLQVPGWETITISPHSDPKKANRDAKFMYKLGDANYDYLIYLDGNLGIWRSLDPLVQQLEDSGAALGLFKHPDRSSVAEELVACVTLRKITEDEFDRENQELEKLGIPAESIRLWAASCLIKRNRPPDLERIMLAWSKLFAVNSLRDQIWLGAALSQSGGSMIEFEHWSNACRPRLFLHRHRASEGLKGFLYFQVAYSLMEVLRTFLVWQTKLFCLTERFRR